MSELGQFKILADDERTFEEYDWQNELASVHVWERGDGSFADEEIRKATPEESPHPEPETVPDPDNLKLGDPYEGTRDAVKRVSVDA